MLPASDVVVQSLRDACCPSCRRQVLTDTADLANTVIGTPYYMSPELCESAPYDYKVTSSACAPMFEIRHSGTC